MVNVKAKEKDTDKEAEKATDIEKAKDSTLEKTALKNDKKRESEMGAEREEGATEVKPNMVQIAKGVQMRKLDGFDDTLRFQKEPKLLRDMMARARLEKYDKKERNKEEEEE